MRPSANRRPTNLLLDETIIAEACGLNIDLSRAAEDGIARAVKMERGRLWQLENATAIAEMNDYIDRNGLPSANPGSSDVSAPVHLPKTVIASS